MLDGKLISWWESLSQDEKDILITVLYNLDLDDYVNYDEQGNIVSIQQEY